MQIFGKTRTGFLLSTALMVSVGTCGAVAHAQRAPSATQTQSGATPTCSGVDANGMPVSPNDSSCGPFAPGFATPSTNVPTEAQQPVTAVVRLEALVQKPERTPFPVEYTAVGSSTMIKVKLPRLVACFKAGKALSDRNGAATSTTCLDHKGEVIAFEECKPKVGDTPGSCSTVIPKDQTGTVASAKP